MSTLINNAESVQIRPLQYRDLTWLEPYWQGDRSGGISWDALQRWFPLLKLLSTFPNPARHLAAIAVAESGQKPCGAIQMSPFNHSRSTWRIDRVLALLPSLSDGQSMTLAQDVGIRLLRHCLETVWEARTWIGEVDSSDQSLIALYRQTGFQPLAQLNHWSLSPAQLATLAQREPDLPNLLPVSNVDAGLLYQLDTVSMPPLLRQTFDRHVDDFRIGLLRRWSIGFWQWLNGHHRCSGYVFEPQRKAAIAYFHLQIAEDSSQSHVARLTVHPAYTWLYPELIAHMARLLAACPAADLHLSSADYQPEREEYLKQIGAEHQGQRLLMARSVWHKLRETRFVSLEGLQLADVFNGLQPGRAPAPGRIGSTAPVPIRTRNAEPLLSTGWDLPPVL
ncbi:GNAT family N-acetyltransferase [Synechococcus elongatus]|uniref:GNAT family N-acetyltransferase n=1 Tax=Synechococcus elongatus TaxID=32046 RepID=UPI0030CD1CEB